jgi:archaellum component FlaD/FlaE
MTGSIHQLNRQHSSTTGGPTMHKTSDQKLRRCSSADDHNSMELVHDVTERKEILFVKRERTASDDDSGTEEIEQQMEHIFMATVNNDEDKLSTKAVSPNFDEGFSENENQQEPQLITITNDRKLTNIVFALSS